MPASLPPERRRSPFVLLGVAALAVAVVEPIVGPRPDDALSFADHQSHLSDAAAVAQAEQSPPALLSRKGWTARADSHRKGAKAAHVLDGRPKTIWHSRWRKAQDPRPHWIRIDMKKTRAVGGILYKPRPGKNRNGTIGRYQVHVSGNAKSWGPPVSAGRLADDAGTKTITFTATARYIRLRALSEAGKRGRWASASEIKVLAPLKSPTRPPAAPAPVPPDPPPSSVPSASPTGTPTSTTGPTPGPTGSTPPPTVPPTGPPPGPPSKGVWSDTVNFPLVPGAAANLPNGNVLAWSAYLPFDWDGNYTSAYGRTQTAILNPRTGNVTARTVSETGHDMFCPGTSLLSDGKIVVTGGTTAGRTSIYDPSTSAWTRGPDMTIPRGYQGQTTLADNRVFTLGGSWSGGTGGKNAEVWSAAAGWQRLTGIPVWPILTADPRGEYRSDNHAWFFTWSGNQVFHAGPSKQMNWFSTAGNGGWSPAGNRGDDDHAMNGDAIMYEAGKILTIGGAPAYDDSPASKRAYVIDIRNGTSVRRVADMAYARAFHNGVVLPDGKVVVVGGQGFAKGFSDAQSVYAAELWDPTTERFTTLASSAVPRNYHSVALLLPDGRVLSAGGGMCGSCGTNHPDAQILTPPNLLNSDGSLRSRPVITGAPATVSAGGSITVTTDRATTSFSVVRLGADTHTVNNDQRRLVLTGTSNAARTSHTLTVPGDRGIALPGYYMLFAMDANGTPSVSHTLRIT